MEAAKKELLAKGGNLGDWTGLITNGLQAEDLEWIDGSKDGAEALEHARRVMSRGAIVEYECYDSRGRPQGRAIMRLEDWEDYAAGSLKGVHLSASDPYYEWYATHDLKDGRAVYHLCSSKRSQCVTRLGRGDRREMIHLERWRMTNPMVMMEHEYTRGVALVAVNNWVSNFTAKVPEPLNPPVPPRGAGGDDPTGLDKALAAAEVPEEVEKPKDKKKKAAEESASEAHPRGSVGALLEKKAAERRAALLEKERKDGKRKTERGRSRSRGRRRRRRKKSSSGGDEKRGDSESSRSSRSFREPSTRGEVELWRLSQKNPGSLLKKGMKEMGRYLADRAPGEEDQEGWMNHRMMAYISQVVLTQHTPAVIGVRNHRELLTLGRAIDMLVQGQLGELGDLLMQRLKALETSLADQGWHSAKHQELIPPHAASLTTETERRQTARMELSANKLKEMTMKGRRNDK